ncbi:unnamed protein product, partial [Urochloa humidicola]
HPRRAHAVLRALPLPRAPLLSAMTGGANGEAGGLRARPKRGLQRVTGSCCGLGGGGGEELSRRR